MNRIDRFLNEARIQRTHSTLPIRVGAVLTRGSRVIKGACNSEGKPPRYLEGWTRHAEVRATLNINAEGATVYVYREHATLKAPLLAKPCNHCVEWLTWLGVKSVIYSIPEYPHYAEMGLDVS